MSRKTDLMLGLPKVNYCTKYLLILWLVACIGVTGLLSIRNVNQLMKQTTITVTLIKLPFEYNYEYNQEIADTYTFGVVAFDVLHLLFTLLLLIGSIELHDGLLGAGARGSFALALIGGILLGLQQYLYKNELNQATRDYLLINLGALIVRNFVSALLALPVKRAVWNRNQAARRLMLTGSSDDLHAMPMISHNNNGVPASAPPDAYYR